MATCLKKTDVHFTSSFHKPARVSLLRTQKPYPQLNKYEQKRHPLGNNQGVNLASWWPAVSAPGGQTIFLQSYWLFTVCFCKVLQKQLKYRTPFKLVTAAQNKL